MGNFINLRTVSFCTLFLVVFATIIHVTSRDLLGLDPSYHLTSAIITFLMGAVFILAGPMLFGDSGRIVLAGADRLEMTDPKTSVLFLIYLGLLAWVIQVTGLYSDFHLASVIKTLFIGGVMLVIMGLGYRVRSQAKNPANSMAESDHSIT